MTPLRLDRLSSPIGGILVLWDDKERLCALDFENFENRMHRLLRRQTGKHSISAAAAPRAIACAVEAYFSGDGDALHALPVKLGGTDFQRQVWRALQDIPAGATTSYGALARQIGRASASRAVGLANGANPIAIRIPCHRVIGANGDLTGYGGGLWRKQWLLTHEEAQRP
ncbi:MAG: methylated-DNA--[protein]-cysteine S-methyltransferase [Alcanivorax sp.]|nr:MAG: methylated-DNA--[protein]-cysteine S-methyltransferase [Alcanivorax sp.]